MVIRGHEERGEVVSVLYLFRCVPLISEDSFHQPYLDFAKISWGPLWATLPTQFALLFFNVLHPPLNVPALGACFTTNRVRVNDIRIIHGI